MSVISSSEIKSLTKEQNHMRGYSDGKSDVLYQIKAEIAMYEADCRLSGDEEPCKQCTNNVFGSIYQIIDKYKAELEGE